MKKSRNLVWVKEAIIKRLFENDNLDEQNRQLEHISRVEIIEYMYQANLTKQLMIII